MILTSLLEGLDYRADGPADIEISGVVYDSRKVKKGYLFICLKGSSVDSHKFAAKAAKAGAAAVLAERELAYSLADMVMATPPYRALRATTVPAAG